jgi:hypothetical protein
MTETTYILTAQLDRDSFVWLDDLRRMHFPPARNVLSAHLTMFHRLLQPQVARLALLPLPTTAIPISFDAVTFLGFGNAIRATSPDLVRLRADIKAAVGDELSRQDSQRWVPHVTIQNKAGAAEARALHTTLTHDFPARAGSAVGLQVWAYLGGPWQLAQTLPFGQDN